jgi:hypothetical protein
MRRDLHKILRPVKRNAPTATSWGWGEAYEIVEMTKGKLSYEFRGSLGNNDQGTLRQRHCGTGPVLPWKPVIRICPLHFGQTRGSTS